VEDLEKKLTDLLEELKKARDPEKGMQPNPSSSKPISKPMGINQKPVFAREHKTNEPRDQVGDREPHKIHDVKIEDDKLNQSEGRENNDQNDKEPKLDEPKNMKHKDQPSIEKGEMCKLAKNGQWSLS
jgi:hypothetical protein